MGTLTDIDINSLPIEIGAASRPCAGFTVSGDQFAVHAFPGGVIVAVADGLGHGHGAAAAAQRAMATIAEAPGQPLRRHFERCNRALAATRGAVLALASIDLATQTMTWASIGNVDAALFHVEADGSFKRASPVMFSGIVGLRMPTIRVADHRMDPGDILVMVTDGIRAGFSDGIDLTLAPQALADAILAHHGKTTDDAMVVVGRWIGAE